MARGSTQDGPSSRTVIYIALTGNFLVAISKFVAAAMTGSSAMLSEGVHSVIDTANELLLLYGMRRASVRPDYDHPLGYGREVFFWSFVVALLIFTLGAGISIYEGVIHILNPRPIENPAITYVVLGLAALFEGTSWITALRKFKGKRKYRQLFRLVVHSKDPPTFIVLLEDSAALIGIAIAFSGIYLSLALQEPVFDGAASILIGITLCIVSLILIRESKGLLVGEAATPEVVASVTTLTLGDPAVIAVNQVLTLVFGPEEVLLNIEAQFTPTLSVNELAMAVSRLQLTIRRCHPKIKRIFIEVAPTTQ